MASLDELRQERVKKLETLKAAGLNPYPIVSRRALSIGDLVYKFSSYTKKRGYIFLAGRVKAQRGHGGAVFADLDDGTGKIQGFFKKDELGDKMYSLFQKVVDVGDFIEIKGSPFLTKKREESVKVVEWRMLAKSLRPLPDKWHGLQDTEERFRRRYLDILMSPEVKERFALRAKIVSEIRHILDNKGFLEVETPILQPLAGGASAEPFKTHLNALDVDLYLRIAPELYLKKLLIAGCPKVYEVSRNFRNEGIDVTHNPEFTTVEYYEAYSDAEKQMIFIEKMFRGLIKKFAQAKIALPKKFSRIKFYDLMRRQALITNPESISQQDLILRAQQLGIRVNESNSRVKTMDSIYKKVCKPKLISPTFVTDYPIEYLPLAKRVEKNSAIASAFQLVIGGLELVKSFSELNDPIDQAERFKEQNKLREAGDKEAQPADTEFVEALEYGMPPAGGVGIGIDRLTMLLTDTRNIREVIIFPTLRPK